MLETRPRRFSGMSSCRVCIQTSPGCEAAPMAIMSRDAAAIGTGNPRRRPRAATYPRQVDEQASVRKAGSGAEPDPAPTDPTPQASRAPATRRRRRSGR